MISLRDVVTGFGVRDPLAEVWRRSLRGGGGGAAEITGVPPLRYIGDGRPLTDYRIAGNTVQDGAPSPDAPVDATGCGVRTEFEPYGYKLPMTVNGAEHPIYLGEVESTRRVKKLVLTGEESWSVTTAQSKTRAVANFTTSLGLMPLSLVMSTHHKGVEGGAAYPDVNTISITPNGTMIIGITSDFTDANDFKSYLAAQYAAGTPVTVWYVLAEPETAIVNEPLMKIGDYADTVSFAQAGVTIPTVNGANVLDMTFPVKPSEVYIKGKGIKPTGYGQLVDKNGVRILDKNDVRILVHGQ